jgi:hypothetical protein
MQLKTRELQEEDRPLLNKWWSDWGWEGSVTDDFLPNTGYIVEKGEQPIASIFIYETNSGVGALGWPLSDKEYRNDDRKEAVSLLIEAAEKGWKNKGGKFLFFWGSSAKLNDNLMENGFIEGDTNYSHLIKKI